jgi:alpha-L-fucosidase
VPTRRDFVAGLAAGAGLVPAGAFVMHRLSAPGDVALPSRAQLDWLDRELGMFVHLAPNTWQDREGDDASILPEHLPFAADPVQWADVAVSLGARYLVMVAKHQGGFCLWQTMTSSYSVRNTAWRDGRGDVMAELDDACRSRGLGLGVYLSPRDDFHGAGVSGRCATPEAQESYNAIARQQLTELLTRYGRMVEIWFDGSTVVPVADILDARAGEAMIFQGPRATIRWIGNEDGYAPEPLWNALPRAAAAGGVATAAEGNPRGDAWLPLEVDVSIRRPNWFWSTRNAGRLLSLEQLLQVYYRSVGRGAQLLLNLPPDTSGRIPDADAARAAEFGAEVRRRFGTPVASGRGAGPEVTLASDGRGPVDHVILEEELRDGQRILAWALEGRRDGAWRALGAGASIGHKRIQPVERAAYEALRVRISESVGTPALRRFAAFHTGAEPPAGWHDPN